MVHRLLLSCEPIDSISTSLAISNPISFAFCSVSTHAVFNQVDLILSQEIYVLPQVRSYKAASVAEAARALARPAADSDVR